jgi:hypothetical protein
MLALLSDVLHLFREPRSASALALLLACGCSDPDPLTFVAHFSVTADEKTPIAGAQIGARGKAVGSTDAAGELSIKLHGFEGDRVAIRLVCPGGYAASPADSTLILRSVQGLGGDERKPLDHNLGCQPTKRDAVVLVRVSGATASLPVKIDGAVVGQTDSLGFGHFHLRTDPGSRFEVSLDTSSNEKLMPQNPLQAFEVDKKDDLFVFDRAFKLPPKPKAKRKASKAKPKVHIPTRLN